MPQFTTPHARWAALQTREPGAANAFVYCVITTKIYCRPTCPSRLARRANIVFHDTAAEAAQDGFRACKRCRPELIDGDGDPQKIAVEKACALIRREEGGGVKGKWSVKKLAMEVSLTESHFCRIFKKVIGMTVGEYRACLSALPTEEIPEMFNADRQLDTALLFDSGEPFLSASIGGEGWLSSAGFSDLQRMEEANRFGGHTLSAMAFPPDWPMYLDSVGSDQSSPDPFSGLSNFELIGDGFQYFDFGGPTPTDSFG